MYWYAGYKVSVHGFGEAGEQISVETQTYTHIYSHIIDEHVEERSPGTVTKHALTCEKGPPLDRPVQSTRARPRQERLLVMYKSRTRKAIS